MTAWVSDLTALISAHPHWAGLLVFVVAASEAIVLAGYLIPGTLILLAVGGIVGLGQLPLLPILMWAAAGAIAGDGLSYWLGHRYREGLRTRWPFSRYPDLIDKGEAFFRHHGGKSVAIGRFVPVLKPIIPVVAGILGMRPTHFYLVNILSALVWAPAHILPGVLAGASLDLLRGVSPRLAVAALGVILAAAAALWLARVLVLRTLPVLGHLARRVYAWTQRHPGSPLRRLARLFDPQHPSTPGVVVALALMTLALLGFVTLGNGIVSHDSLVRADHAISTFARGLRNPWTDPYMIAIAGLNDAVVTGALALALVGWLLLRGAWRLGAASAAILVLVGAALALAKLLIPVPDPPTGYAVAGGFYFPGGNTALAAAAYGIAVWLMARGVRPRARALVYAVVFLWVLAMAAARIYLGDHWPSDVLAGLCLGLLAPATLAALYHQSPRAALLPGPMAIAMALVLSGVGTWHLGQTWPADLAHYRPRRAPQVIDVAAWRKGTGLQPPPRRIDLSGDLEEPLVLQWLGTAKGLAERQGKAGWGAPPVWTLQAAIGFLRPDTPVATLPALPTLHNGQRPALTLTKALAGDTGKRWVLRAWPSGLETSPAGPPLLLASLVEQRATHPAQILTFVRSRPAPAAAVEHLLTPLRPFSVTRVRISGDEITGTFPVMRAEQGSLPAHNKKGATRPRPSFSRSIAVRYHHSGPYGPNASPSYPQPPAPS